MSCKMCDIWSSFDGPGSKCSRCQVTNEVPAWAILAGLEDDYKESSQSELKSATVKEQEKPYWAIFLEYYNW